MGLGKINPNIKSFLQYGVSSKLAERAVEAGLTVSTTRATSIATITTKFKLTKKEAKELKMLVKRQPIDQNLLFTLLERHNFTCAVCKGQKGKSFVIHHIEPYSKSQNNEYQNLIVLCPTDHDLAHGSGLSMSISQGQLKKLKRKWEKQVEIQNTQKAARRIEVNDGAIDYINIHRIEELCLQIFEEIPKTKMSEYLLGRGIIDEDGFFQKDFVRKTLSGGGYLFDYMGAGETFHYRSLMQELADEVGLVDLSDAIDHGKRAVQKIEGEYGYFIGGVYSKHPKYPVTSSTPAITMHYTKRRIRVEWILDPNFFMSSSAIFRQGQKNRYIIYCLIRSVIDNGADGMLVKASPYLIAQPKQYINKKPAIAYMRESEEIFDDETDDEWLDEE